MKMDAIRYDILHHTAGHETYEQLLAYTKRNWGGRYVLPYHWLIDMNGHLHRGQPEGEVCPHAGFDKNDGSPIHNWNSLGICCVGNFDVDHMSPEVFTTLVRLLQTHVKRYGFTKANFRRHKDVVNTACPGKNFPYEDIINEVFKVEKPKEPAKPWYTEAMQFCLKEELMTGDEGGMRPNDPITRAETATMFMRLVAKIRKGTL